MYRRIPPRPPTLDESLSRFASFPQTGVSIAQMIAFGRSPLSPGTILKSSQFLTDELPIRLAHRVKQLGLLQLSGMK